MEELTLAQQAWVWDLFITCLQLSVFEECVGNVHLLLGSEAVRPGHAVAWAYYDP